MKIIYKILPFLVIKQPCFYAIYLNFLASVVGVIYMLNYRKIFKEYIFIFLMVFIGFLTSIYNESIFSFLRLCQLVTLQFFSMYLVLVFAKYDCLKICKFILLLATIVFAFEIAFFDNSGFRNFFGLQLPRYRGIIGEYNFTALLLTGIGFLFYNNKRYFLFFVSFSSILLTANRSFIGALFLFFLFIITLRINKRVAFGFGYICFYLMLLYPFIILIVDNVLDLNYKILIDNFSSLRYQLHVAYAYMGFDNFGFGAGYFNGKNLILDSKFLLRIGALYYNNFALEQHNLFLQVFSEFGIIGYSCFCLFMMTIVNKAKNTDRLFFAFISFLFCCLFVNALHEIVIYIYIAYIIYREKNA